MTDTKKVKVSGEKAKLIEEGVKIKVRMKEDEKRIAAIKTELGYKSAGVYVTAKGAVLDIAENNSPAVIPPKVVLAELKKKRLGPRFGECVKIVIKNLESVIGAQDTEALKKQYEGKITQSWTFK